MYTLNVTETQELIREIAVNLRQPVMLWGQPGVGKSEGVKQVADSYKSLLVDIRLGQYDSVDLRGIPVVNREEHSTTWYAPETIPFKGNKLFDPEAEHIFLFFDELTGATRSVANVAYQIINDRRVGEHELMDNVIMVCASNRDGDRGATNKMPLPLANRMTHAEVGVDADTWCEDYAIPQGLPMEGIAFIKFRKPLLSTFDPSTGEKVFATPRTWVKAFQVYMSGASEHIKQAAMAGWVGDGPAAEFWGFLNVWRKMTPISEIIKNPMGVKLPEEASMNYAVAIAISGSMTPENVTPLNKYLNRLDPEFTVMAWQLASRRDEDLFATPEFMEIATKFKAVYEVR